MYKLCNGESELVSSHLRANVELFNDGFLLVLGELSFSPFIVEELD